MLRQPGFCHTFPLGSSLLTDSCKRTSPVGQRSANRHLHRLRWHRERIHCQLPFSRGVKRWLDQNLAARYDLSALAEAFQVSTRTMLHRFGQEAGQTPLVYLQSARVRRACHLLETSDRTVAGIAADLGCADTSTRTLADGPGVHLAAVHRTVLPSETALPGLEKEQGVGRPAWGLPFD
ncbi:helix-turn-helix domain-containing protein [Streptomyces sp. NPDC054794]